MLQKVGLFFLSHKDQIIQKTIIAACAVIGLAVAGVINKSLDEETVIMVEEEPPADADLKE